MVFLDDGPWISFNQMAARVRRDGCRTLRVTCDPSLASRRPNLLLFTTGAVVSSWDDLPRLDDLVTGEVIDIQCAEPLLRHAQALADASSTVAEPARERLRTRITFGDKTVAMDRLQAVGIAVPDHLADDVPDVDGAIAALGLPIVIKPGTGAAGAEVIVARDRAQAVAAWEAVRLTGPSFFERYVDGEQLSFCAVFYDGIVVADGAYAREREGDSVSFAEVIETLDDPAIFELGARVVAVIGGSGLVDLDILRDEHGNDWVIDVNLRAWHSLGALLGAGIDFTKHYLGVIGIPMRADREPCAHVRAQVCPSLVLRGDGGAAPAAPGRLRTSSLHRCVESVTSAFAIGSASC